MAGKLIGEVMAYLGRHPEVTTAERLVLILIADRARLDTRRAWSKRRRDGTRDWDLARLAGMTEDGLRKVLQKLARRWLDVRVPHSWDSKGQPVYAHRGLQVTYQLPSLEHRVFEPEGGTDMPPWGDATDPEGDTWVPPSGVSGSTSESTSDRPSDRPSGDGKAIPQSAKAIPQSAKAVPTYRPNSLETPEGLFAPRPHAEREALPHHASRDGDEQPQRARSRRADTTIKEATARIALGKAARIVAEDQGIDDDTAAEFIRWLMTKRRPHDPVAYVEKLRDDGAFPTLIMEMEDACDACNDGRNLAAGEFCAQCGGYGGHP